ncbi:MAG TPA: VWA domain-containing protein [Parachlamydiaceae bacterium]|nr:VWA domain-containing protein [Parachlamydiaceae bacterium]
MYHFYWPWFALLLPLPFLVRWIVPSKGKKEGLEVHFPALNRLKNAFPLTPVLQKRSNAVSWSFLYLVWTLLVLALMQPEKVDQFIQVKNKGYDLMLAVDISASMQAVDFSTPAKTVSRLDATKDVVSKFVLGRQGDRIGLVAFGEKAYLHVPLTLDTLSVSKMLNQMVPGMAGNATAIGDAIGLSVRTLRDRPEGSRVLVLLTDGEDNASSVPPLEAAKIAKQYGIKIYTIGVGSNGNVPFPNGRGSYQMVRVTIDEGLLKEIAATTGGQYFLATDQKALASIYKKIDGLEKTESNQNVYLIREPLYAYPLGTALVLLLVVTLFQILGSLYRRRITGGI